MIFQWYLFVLMIVVALGQMAIGNAYYKNENGSVRYGNIAVFLLILPMIYLAATRRRLQFGDTSAYTNWFLEFPNSISGLTDYLTPGTKDKGFTVFSVLIKTFIGNNVEIYFAIIALVCIVCVAKTYQNYSCNFIMSMFLFVASGEYLQWTFNGIRQFIPVAICFACTGLLVKKKYLPLICIIIVVSTIHATALLMIPIIFIVQGEPWNAKTLGFGVVVIMAIAYLDRFTNLITSFMENTQYSNEVGQFLSTEGTNILRVFVFAIPPILALLFRRYINHANSPIINLSVNMSIISLGIYIVSAFTSGIFIGRLPIYFSLYNYILIPWIIENCFEKRSAKLVYLFLIIAYLFFYYYQVTITWGL